MNYINRFAYLKEVFLIIALCVFIFISYIIFRKALVTDLPVGNMPELGMADRYEYLKENYNFFIHKSIPIQFLPIFPMVFSMLYPIKGSKRSLLIGIVFISVLWITTWEILLKLTNTLILGCFWEGCHTSNTLLFNEVDLVIVLPFTLLATMMIGLAIRNIKKSLVKK